MNSTVKSVCKVNISIPEKPLWLIRRCKLLLARNKPTWIAGQPFV